MLVIHLFGVVTLLLVVQVASKKDPKTSIELNGKTYHTGSLPLPKEEKARLEKVHHRPTKAPRRKAHRRGGGGGGKHRMLIDIHGEDTLPENFDWRDESNCSSIQRIRNQQCGNCYAVASIAAFSDRYCLFTGNDVIFSEKEATLCIIKDRQPWGNGCHGGWPQMVYDWLNQTGIVTGGDPTLSPPLLPAGCMANAKNDPIITKSDDDSDAERQYYNCPTKCDNGKRFNSAVTAKGSMATVLWEINPSGTAYGNNMTMDQHINETMWELYLHGPIAVLISAGVFDDKYLVNGVYQGIDSDADILDADGNSILARNHIVRLIGWGTKDGIPYWLIANQWDTTWPAGSEGKDRGTAKILRGNDVWGIDHYLSWNYPLEAYVDDE